MHIKNKIIKKKINNKKKAEGVSHHFPVFQLYNTFRKSNVWQYEIYEQDRADIPFLHAKTTQNSHIY